MRVDTLQAIAEPHRREILALVWDDEMAAGDIASRFDLTFGAVSQHLGVLRETGLVSVRRDGNRRWYKAEKQQLGPLRQVLEAMWADSLERLAHAVERDTAEDSK